MLPLLVLRPAHPLRGYFKSAAFRAHLLFPFAVWFGYFVIAPANGRTSAAGIVLIVLSLAAVPYGIRLARHLSFEVNDENIVLRTTPARTTIIPLRDIASVLLVRSLAQPLGPANTVYIVRNAAGNALFRWVPDAWAPEQWTALLHRLPPGPVEVVDQPITTKELRVRYPNLVRPEELGRAKKQQKTARIVLAVSVGVFVLLNVTRLTGR
ncbi:hypothetical protein EH165_11255 [Nakamurella antarctica]|uniref:PH domain-containing protein n=1 Tax=Nakamurella antarctica TaxID=1902245 RepID=A0A3G8ZVZ3_9ACTN|nr:hypothetical protein [Nakamurella antarctica]AZI58624.1 hypothetical protein EH165_11255 [Nakamurella antarctica]